MWIYRTFVQKYTEPPDPCKTDPDCINGGHQPLLKNIRTGLIDPDTPKSALTKKGGDGSTLKLVVCLIMKSMNRKNNTSIVLGRVQYARTNVLSK